MDTNTSGTSAPTLVPTSIENDHNHPTRQPSVNSYPAPETVIESFYETNGTANSLTNIAGSDLVPVSILRRTLPDDIHNHPLQEPSINSNHITSVPVLRENKSSRKQSINYHPNMPRYSVDFSASHPFSNQPQIPAFPKLIPEPVPHQTSVPIKAKKK